MAGGPGEGVLACSHLENIGGPFLPLPYLYLEPFLYSAIEQKGKVRRKGRMLFMTLLGGRVPQDSILDPSGREERTERQESRVRANVECPRGI